MASRISTARIGVAFSSYLGPEKNLFRARRPGPCQSIVGPCHTASSGKVPVVELWRDFFWTQVRREGKSCRVSHLQTTLSRDTLENFVIEDVVAGLEEELSLLRHAISGALADTNEWTRTNVLWTNTFSYVYHMNLTHIWVNEWMVASLMSLMASLVTTSRMKQCFNVLIDIYHEFLLLFYSWVLLEIKLTTTK